MKEANPISPAVRVLLAELREQLNAKYRQRAATGVKIDGPSWLRHIEQTIAPVIASVHSVAPDRSKETLLELYDIGLDLSGLGHFNEIGGSLHVIELWRDCFPAIGPVLSLSPRTVIGSLSNAVLYLSQLSSIKTENWVKMLTRLGPECRTVDQLLNLGKFLGWTSGFAHMRQSAIQLAADLPVDLLRVPLGLPDPSSEQTVRDHLRELALQPWANVSGVTRAVTGTRTMTVAEVCRCGNFRGLDGEFLHPPKTYLCHGQIHITDGTLRWQLHADRFGYTLQRVDSKDAIPDRAKTIPNISKDGLLSWDGITLQRVDLAQSTSQSFDGSTMAVTIPTSYHVFLFAWQVP